MEPISTHTALSCDHLPVILEVFTDICREIPSHFVFDYQNADWCRFRQSLDSRLDLDLSLDRIERETQINSMVQNFTEAILEARSLSVPLVRPPNRCCLTITQAQNLTEECSSTKLLKTLRTVVKLRNLRFVICGVELGNRAFVDKLRSLRPRHKSFWNFTKIVKNKCRNVPTLKVNGVTLITEQEKASTIAEKFPRAHENTVQSPLSVLHDDRFNVNPSALTFPREVKKAIKRLKSAKAPGFEGVPNIILKNMSRRAFVYLTYEFNSCSKLSSFPKIWKHASVSRSLARITIAPSVY
jgi:hypothetical protein